MRPSPGSRQQCMFLGDLCTASIASFTCKCLIRLPVSRVTCYRSKSDSQSREDRHEEAVKTRKAAAKESGCDESKGNRRRVRLLHGHWPRRPKQAIRARHTGQMSGNRRRARRQSALGAGRMRKTGLIKSECGRSWGERHAVPKGAFALCRALQRLALRRMRGPVLRCCQTTHTASRP
jgi:hypothetical protein